MKHWLAIAAIILVAGYVYSAALDGEFLFDDQAALSALRAGASTGGVERWLTQGLYRMDYWLAGENPRQFHATNLAVHLVNCVLIYTILVALVPVAALWGALIFAVHPLFGESVQYVTARSAALTATFIWAGLAALLYFRGYRRILLCAGAVLLAFFAKEDGLLALPLLLMAWALRIRRPRALKLAVLAGALCSIGFVAYFYYSGLPVMAGEIVNPSVALRLGGITGPLTRWEHTQVVIQGFLHIVTIAILPITLSADPAQDNIFAAIIGMIVIGWFVAILLWHGNYRVRLAVLSIVMSPPLGRLLVANDSSVYEYRGYLCGLGVAILAALGLSQLSSRWRPVAALSAILALSLVTLHRNAVWHDKTALWEDAASVAQPNLMTLMNLGSAYMADRQFDAAIEPYELALRLKPILPLAEEKLGALYLMRGEPGKSMTHFNRAVIEEPQLASAWENYAGLMLAVGRPVDARYMAQRALSLTPTSPTALYNLHEAVQRLGIH